MKTLLIAMLVLGLTACSQEPGALPLHTTLNASGFYTGTVTSKG